MKYLEMLVIFMYESIRKEFEDKVVQWLGHKFASIFHHCSVTYTLHPYDEMIVELLPVENIIQVEKCMK